MNQDDQIDETALERLIPAFYDRVRADADIGPLFNAAVHDWSDHLEKLIAFWSSVMLTSGRYKGSPVTEHLKHKSAITPAMFDRWLLIWADTTNELLAPAAAAALQAKATRIAESLQLALFFRLGDPAGRRAA